MMKYKLFVATGLLSLLLSACGGVSSDLLTTNAKTFVRAVNDDDLATVKQMMIKNSREDSVSLRKGLDSASHFLRGHFAQPIRISMLNYSQKSMTSIGEGANGTFTIMELKVGDSAHFIPLSMIFAEDKVQSCQFAFDKLQPEKY